jgi:RNA polymerase I-specific transcription initiation factor RRN3
MIIISCLELDVNILIKDNGSVTFDESEEQIKANMAKEAEIQEEDRETADAWKTSNDESIDEVSDKLDAILEMLFVKLQSFADHDVRTARRVFRDLLPTFERSVLPTHKAKFVQFCMFLSCALEARAAAMSEANSIVNKSGVNLPPVTPEPPVGDDDDDHGETILDREFAAKLIEIIVDPYRATTTRQSSACYLASFVSRATFVKVDTVCESISTLLSWAEAYIEALGPNAIRAADARRQGDLHALFYTACQAAFYIMSFRGKEAISYYRAMLSNDTQANQDLDGTTVDGIDLSCKRWTFLCGHPLQPLRICLESVRSEFLHVAHFYDLIDEPVMNRLVADAKRISSGRVNKKAASTISTAATLQLKRQNGGVGGLGHGSNPLKTFFPFDPLLLRRTYEFIEPIYRNWGGPVEEEDVLIIDDGPGEGILDENKDEFPDEGSDVDDDDDDDEDEGVFEMEEDQQRDESKLASDANDDSDEEDTERESVNRTDSRDNKFGVSSMRQQRFQLQLSPLQRDDDGDDEDATSVGENYRARSGTLSTINSDPETNERDPIYGTPQKSLTAADQKARQMKAWTDATSKAKKKRPRSTSMDGSW